MPEIRLWHETVSDRLGKGVLVVDTGLNDVRWGYHLNTSVTPTYGGEVVQILSAFIDDLYVRGETSSYAEMEDIAEWLIAYFEVATQGQSTAQSGSLSYNEQLVFVSYPARGWNFTVKPINLPNIRWHRDVVVPTYEIQAAVVEPDPQMTTLTIDGAVKGLDEIPAGLGYLDANPFSNPFPVADGKNKAVDGFDPNETRKAYDQAADWYNGLIPSYMKGEFGTLSEDVSKPAFLNPDRKVTTRQAQGK